MGNAVEFRGWRGMRVTPRCAGPGCNGASLCPPGHVCARGSSAPRACPPGTYAPLHGNTNASTDCAPCVAGSYCGPSPPSLQKPSPSISYQDDRMLL